MFFTYDKKVKKLTLIIDYAELEYLLRNIMLMEHNNVLRLDKLDDNESRLIDSCCMQH